MIDTPVILTFRQMADRPLIVRLIMRIADFPEELARKILGELVWRRGMGLITTPTFGVPRPAPITLLYNVWPNTPRGRPTGTIVERMRRFRLPNLSPNKHYRYLVPSFGVPYQERRGRWTESLPQSDGISKWWGYLQ